jgi:hypothetical protein
MARFSAGAVSTGAGSTTLPLMALTSAAATGFHLREVGIFNTTSTAAAMALARITTAGTPGASVGTPGQMDDRSAAAACVVKQTYSSTAPTTSYLGYNAQLGAAVGSGIVWVFGDIGISAAVATANGVGVLVANGTGQICNIYFVWDE